MAKVKTILKGGAKFLRELVKWDESELRLEQISLGLSGTTLGCGCSVAEGILMPLRLDLKML